MDRKLEPLILVGPRCTGKTTKGITLASWLGCKFKDGDVETVEAIEECYNIFSIDDFVKSKGWQEFRKIESDAISWIAKPDNQQMMVYAPGGGAVAHDQGEEYRQRNIDLLRNFGVVVYITPSNDLMYNSSELAYRIVNDPRSKNSRPKLNDTQEMDISLSTFVEQIIRHQNKGLSKAIYLAHARSSSALQKQLSMDEVNAKIETDDMKRYVSELIDMYNALQKRDPLYKQASHITVFTGGMENHEACKTILGKYFDCIINKL
ncbi:MAG: shikimate kinase [Candidatus Woesearchaeota archaeon]